MEGNIKDKKDTGLSADSVEWYGGENILACGTYQLHEASGERKGAIQLYKLENNQECSRLILVEEHVCTGVLDIKWSLSDGTTSLYTACADGTIKAFQLQITEMSSSLVHRCNVTLEDPYSSTIICLSIDHRETSLLASDSRGNLSLASIGSNGVAITREWKAHSHEAWIAAFGSNKDTVLSGGDDCKLCLWDMRADHVSCLVTKGHEMGVCSIQSHPTREHLFASGSYDETVTLWDMRSLKQSLKQIEVGGGVWRVKWHPSEPDISAHACMHGGSVVVNWSTGEIIGRYNGHESLAYGIDWCLETSLRQFLLASCSFYDHALHLWMINL